VCLKHLAVCQVHLSDDAAREKSISMIVYEKLFYQLPYPPITNTK
jgi:hypothetical protein